MAGLKPPTQVCYAREWFESKSNQDWPSMSRANSWSKSAGLAGSDWSKSNEEQWHDWSSASSDSIRQACEDDSCSKSKWAGSDWSKSDSWTSQASEASDWSKSMFESHSYSDELRLHELLEDMKNELAITRRKLVDVKS